mmetsp:Transcript_27807/g.76550  ORF Transcript_27807/g.76550 Transcript_27807/m.76550 type:complete len:512 (+) Transcript_27807:320-1855(+)
MNVCDQSRAQISYGVSATRSSKTQHNVKLDWLRVSIVCCLALTALTLYPRVPEQDRKTMIITASNVLFDKERDSPSKMKSSLEENKEGRYLLFVTHSGYANQLFGLKRAAQLAYHSDRILVLPPVLPHVSIADLSGKNLNDDENLEEQIHRFFSQPKALGRPQWYCTPGNKLLVLEELLTQARVLAQALSKEVYDKHNCSSSVPSFFVSHAQLADFESITRDTGTGFIDFPEFIMRMEQEEAARTGRNGSTGNITSSWSLGKNPEMDYTGECTGKKKKNAQRVVDQFEKNFGNSRVAVMHSGYILDPLDMEPTSGPLFADSILAFPLASPLQQLVTHLVQERLPSSYMGLHMRFRDRARLEKSCRDEKTTVIYQGAFEELELLAKNMDTATPINLLIGMSNKAAKKCFQELGEPWFFQNSSTPLSFHTFTIEDLMRDKKAQLLAEKVFVDQATLALVLDQVLLGMAPAGTAYASYMPPLTGGVKRSTFQQVVDLRQQKYQEGLRERRVAKS